MEKINIFFSADNNYSQPLGVALYSLLHNFYSNTHTLKINILDGGISEINKKKIKDIGEKFRTDIHFINTQNIDTSKYPDAGRYTTSAYYKLSIPEIVGKNINKVIYLDCDILVVGNIVELYEKEISKYLLGAVKDKNWKSIYQKDEPYYKDIKKYFNSGVLLINVENWKKENVAKKIASFLDKNYEKLNTADQDIFNYVCNNQWFELEEKWNFQIDRTQRKVNFEPIILHFFTWYKPWYAFYNNYYKKYYREYSRFWPGYKTKNFGLKTTIKEIIKNFFQ
jgi:lipopolysaccharide biosynthesis glycosyltransferase